MHEYMNPQARLIRTHAPAATRTRRRAYRPEGPGRAAHKRFGYSSPR